MYTITRQRQWPEGAPVVEISTGGLDYTNPDALAAKYNGEFEEFDNPMEAVEAAILICRAWRKDGETLAGIGYGNTLGMTIPFDTTSEEELRAWGKAQYEALAKCPMCGDIMEGAEEWYEAGTYSPEGEFWPYDDGEKYCSEHCSGKASEFPEEDEEAETE